MINYKHIASSPKSYAQEPDFLALLNRPASPGNLGKETRFESDSDTDSVLNEGHSERRRASGSDRFTQKDYYHFDMGTQNGTSIKGKLLNPFHFPDSKDLVAKLNRKVTDWVLEMGLMQGDDVLGKITGARFSNLVAGPCSALPENKAIVNAFFVAFLFFYDDRIDQETQTLGSVETLNKNLMNTFHVQNPTSEDNLIRALSSFVSKAQASNIPLEGFSRAVREYFSSAETEIHDRAGDNPISDPITYMDRREISGAVYSVFELSMASAGIVLPEEIKTSKYFSAMLQHAVRAICIANDIYSFRKEGEQESIPDNLIVVEMKESQLSVEDSLKKVIRFHDIQVNRYLHHKERLIALYSGRRDILLKLCEFYERWMNSNQDFSSTSIRYILPST